MTKKSGKVSWLLVGLLTLLCLSVTSVCLAQGSNNASARQEVYQSFVNKLATELNSDVAKVEKALQAASSQALQVAAKKGLVSPDQAKKIQASIDQGKWWAFNKAMKSCNGVGKFGDMASLLGMTPQALKQELQTGKTLGQVAAAKGMSLEQLKARWLAGKKSELDQMVSAGKLTPEKAQQVYSQLTKVDFSTIGGKCTPK